MSTATEIHDLEHTDDMIHGDDFSALEQRVMRLVDLLRTERRERRQAEETAATLQQLLDEQGAQLGRAEDELRSLGHDRDQVRGRVERLLKELDELG